MGKKTGASSGLRLAEVVTLDRIGAVIPEEFEVACERRVTPEPLPHDCQFAPAQRTSLASF